MSNKKKWIIIISIVLGLLVGSIAGSLIRGEEIKWKGVSFNLFIAAFGFYALLFFRKEKGLEDSNGKKQTSKKKKTRK